MAGVAGETPEQTLERVLRRLDDQTADVDRRLRETQKIVEDQLQLQQVAHAQTTKALTEQLQVQFQKQSESFTAALAAQQKASNDLTKQFVEAIKGVSSRIASVETTVAAAVPLPGTSTAAPAAPAAPAATGWTTGGGGGWSAGGAAATTGWTTGGGAGWATGGGSGAALVDNKGLAKPPIWGKVGEKMLFAHWKYKMTSWINGVFPGAKDVLVWAVSMEKEITVEELKIWTSSCDESWLMHLDAQLATTLGSQLEDEALDIVIAHEGRGFEAWRCLNRRFDPQTEGGLINRFDKINLVKVVKEEELMRAIQTWESEIREYKIRGGRAVTDELMRSLLRKMVQGDLQRHLILNDDRFPTYPIMKKFVEDYLVKFNKSYEVGGATPMEVSPFHRDGKGGGGGKSSGGGGGGKHQHHQQQSEQLRKPNWDECSYCYRTNHRVADCRDKAEGKPKGGGLKKERRSTPSSSSSNASSNPSSTWSWGDGKGAKNKGAKGGGGKGGKGKGGKGKGKGKGVNAFETDDGTWANDWTEEAEASWWQEQELQAAQVAKPLDALEMRPPQPAPRTMNEAVARIAQRSSVTAHRTELSHLDIASYNWAERHAGGWTRVWMMVDSGCGSSASPASVAPAVPIKPSPASMSGTQFSTASGECIPAQGERKWAATLAGGRQVSLKFEICKIDKPLLSVADLNDKDVDAYFTKKEMGSRLIFSDGEWQTLVRYNRTFWLEVWLEPGQGGVVEQAKALGFARDHLPHEGFQGRGSADRCL